MVVNQMNSRIVFTLIQCLAVCRERWLLRVLCPQIEVDWPRCLVLSSMISEYWQSKRPIMSLFLTVHSKLHSGLMVVDYLVNVIKNKVD